MKLRLYPINPDRDYTVQDATYDWMVGHEFRTEPLNGEVHRVSCIDLKRMVEVWKIKVLVFCVGNKSDELVISGSGDLDTLSFVTTHREGTMVLMDQNGLTGIGNWGLSDKRFTYCVKETKPRWMK